MRGLETFLVGIGLFALIGWGIFTSHNDDWDDFEDEPEEKSYVTVKRNGEWVDEEI